MFRLHFQEEKPNTYRAAYQSSEVKEIIKELLDYLFLEERIIMINTCACMFATTLTQKEVDRLSEALFKGFRLIRPRLIDLVSSIKSN